VRIDEIVSAITSNGCSTECPADGETAALWAMSIARTEACQDELTAPEVAAIVTRVGRKSMSRQAAQGHLDRLASSGQVHRARRRKGPNQYSLMAAGQEALSGTTNVILVDPARALQETRSMEKLLSQLKGPISICDPYLDERTLDFLGAMTSATSIRVLTEKVTDEDKVKRDLKAVQKQTGCSIEVRKAPKGVLHDRYIIHDGGMLILGTSLNSFGLRQSFVTRAGHDVREATKGCYAEKWPQASPI
jgi:hypothetical protein